MFCKSCGKLIDDDSKFCTHCGAKQSTSKTASHQIDEFIQSNFSIQDKNSQKTDIIKDFNIESLYKNPEYNVEAVSFGSLLLLISLSLVVIQPFKFENHEDYIQIRFILGIVILIIRIIITIWVTNIALRQNRAPFIWGLFAFLLPAISLIAIGLLKSKNEIYRINNSLNDSENSEILYNESKHYLKENDFYKSLKLLKKAIQLNPQNNAAINLFKKIALDIPIHSIKNKEIQVVFREMNDGKIFKIVSKNYETIGASVFFDGRVVEDGEFQYLSDNRKILIKEGKIIELKNN